jgi:CrcB protein
VSNGRQIVAVYVGGMLGTLARATVGLMLPWSVGHWPWATFVVNIGGCAVLGYCVTRLQEQLPVSVYRRPLVGTGVCGGLTTFSTMQLELFRMIGAGDYSLAFAYASLSALSGFTAVQLVTVLARRVRVRISI